MERWAIYTFESKSHPGDPKHYHRAILYRNGATSCDCPGWTKRVKNGERVCPHTIKIKMGNVKDAVFTETFVPESLLPDRTIRRATTEVPNATPPPASKTIGVTAEVKRPKSKTPAKAKAIVPAVSPLAIVPPAPAKPTPPASPRRFFDLDALEEE